MIIFTNSKGSLNIDVLYQCKYYFRQLYLVKLLNTEINKEGIFLFYKSAGITTPDICGQGSVRPILGIYDPNYANMANCVKELWPQLTDQHIGWIAKGGSKSVDDPTTFFGVQILKRMSEILEKADMSNVITLKYNEFANIANSLYGVKNFFPSVLAKRVIDRRNSK